jgi:hypothetical protein
MTRTKAQFSLVIGLLLLAVASSMAMGRRPERLTLLVVPARYSVVQVAMDMARREPAVVLTYQGTAQTQNPLLYAWNGKEWVFVSLDDYRSAQFLRRTPGSILLIGNDELLPEVLTEASAWCPMVINIPSIDSSTLINSLGNHFKFEPADWEWFAKRYNLDLLDLNESQRGQSWYEQPFVETEPPTWPWKEKRYRQSDSERMPLTPPPASYEAPQAIEPLPILDDDYSLTEEEIDIRTPDTIVDDPTPEPDLDDSSIPAGIK